MLLENAMKSFSSVMGTVYHTLNHSHSHCMHSSYHLKKNRKTRKNAVKYGGYVVPEVKKSTSRRTSQRRRTTSRSRGQKATQN